MASAAAAHVALLARETAFHHVHAEVEAEAEAESAAAARAAVEKAHARYCFTWFTKRELLPRLPLPDHAHRKPRDAEACTLDGRIGPRLEPRDQYIRRVR